MKDRMTYRQNIAAAVGVALMASGLMGAAPSEALADAPGHVSNEQLPQLTAQWQQWALSLPNDVNPLVDTTGALCGVGQRGPVWFLAGTFFGGTVIRTCTVPEGTTLFFPVINGFAFNTPGCGQPDDLNTVKKLKKFYYPQVTGFVDQAYDLSATVDDHKLKMQRVEFAVFRRVKSTGKHLGLRCLRYGGAARTGDLFARHRRRVLGDNRTPEGIAEPIHDPFVWQVRGHRRGHHL